MFAVTQSHAACLYELHKNQDIWDLQYQSILNCSLQIGHLFIFSAHLLHALHETNRGSIFIFIWYKNCFFGVFKKKMLYRMNTQKRKIFVCIAGPPLNLNCDILLWFQDKV